jgi:hypothetical protein
MVDEMLASRSRPELARRSRPARGTPPACGDVDMPRGRGLSAGACGSRVLAAGRAVQSRATPDRAPPAAAHPSMSAWPAPSRVLPNRKTGVPYS